MINLGTIQMSDRINLEGSAKKLWEDNSFRFDLLTAMQYEYTSLIWKLAVEIFYDGLEIKKELFICVWLLTG